MEPEEANQLVVHQQVQQEYLQNFALTTFQTMNTSQALQALGNTIQFGLQYAAGMIPEEQARKLIVDFPHLANFATLPPVPNEQIPKSWNFFGTTAIADAVNKGVDRATAAGNLAMLMVLYGQQQLIALTTPIESIQDGNKFVMAVYGTVFAIGLLIFGSTINNALQIGLNVGKIVKAFLYAIKYGLQYGIMPVIALLGFFKNIRTSSAKDKEIDKLKKRIAVLEPIANEAVRLNTENFMLRKKLEEYEKK